MTHPRGMTVNLGASPKTAKATSDQRGYEKGRHVQLTLTHALVKDMSACNRERSMFSLGGPRPGESLPP